MCVYVCVCVYVCICEYGGRDGQSSQALQYLVCVCVSVCVCLRCVYVCMCVYVSMMAEMDRAVRPSST